MSLFANFKCFSNFLKFSPSSMNIVWIDDCIGNQLSMDSLIQNATFNTAKLLHSLKYDISVIFLQHFMISFFSLGQFSAIALIALFFIWNTYYKLKKFILFSIVQTFQQPVKSMTSRFDIAFLPSMKAVSTSSSLI